ncbi:MAG: AMP-binding protein [Prevotella sp.]
MTLSEFYTIWDDPSPRLLVHTSGSTGRPKPLWVEKRRMMASARATNDFLSLRPGDTTLLCMPLDYIAGKMVVVRAIERQLRLLSVPPSNHPLASMPSAGQHIDVAAMVPSQVWSSLREPEEAARLVAIRNIIIGGGTIDSRLEETLRGLPNAIWSSYGMTETLSHIAMRRVSGSRASMWYTPMPGVTVALDSDGCLVIDAPHVHDGRLKTNDMAVIHADGQHFQIIGRKDNVICSGGIKLHIEDIERKLSTRIDTPFCITRRKDEKFGEVAVMLAAGNDIDKATLSECLGRYEMPKEIIHVSHIPLTATGKTDRHAAWIIANGGTEG